MEHEGCDARSAQRLGDVEVALPAWKAVQQQDDRMSALARGKVQDSVQ